MEYPGKFHMKKTAQSLFLPAMVMLVLLILVFYNNNYKSIKVLGLEIVGNAIVGMIIALIVLASMMWIYLNINAEMNKFETP